MRNPIDVSRDVSTALSRTDPVVALESAVISHGLPGEVAVRTALEMEDEIRSRGAMPATIGVIEGVVRVGLTKDEMERLASGKAAKLNVRDLPYAVMRRLDGGATVSATMAVAQAAGTMVMATGGIGGVHRGAAESFDMSADLLQLVRTPMIVTCSGPKAVLDVPATAEWLESHAVPVYGFETDEMPCFYSRTSRIAVPRLDSADEVAELASLSGGVLGVRSAMIVAVPIPAESEIDLRKEIDEAASEAASRGIGGKDLTPYLLNRVAELSKGKSIEANIALLRNNARVASQIACALSDQAQRRIGFLV